MYDNLSGLRAISSVHPLLAGVASLYENNGNSIVLGGTLNANAQILVTTGTHGLCAVYDGRPAASVAYCTAKLNSLGCTPSIGSSGYASVSNSNPFDVTASDVLNHKQGLTFYGDAAAAAPFQRGTLCVPPRTRRTRLQGSAGASSPTNDCSGSYSFDFNAWIQAGVDPLCVAGQAIFAQYWSRDPQSPTTAGSTNGLSLVIGSWLGRARRTPGATQPPREEYQARARFTCFIQNSSSAIGSLPLSAPTWRARS